MSPPGSSTLRDAWSPSLLRGTLAARAAASRASSDSAASLLKALREPYVDVDIHRFRRWPVPSPVGEELNHVLEVTNVEGLGLILQPPTQFVDRVHPEGEHPAGEVRGDWPGFLGPIVRDELKEGRVRLKGRCAGVAVPRELRGGSHRESVREVHRKEVM